MWTADFKGEFRTGDGEYCYPLTVADLHTRYLLECRGLRSTRTMGAQAVFERLFREFHRAHYSRTKVLLGYVAMLWRSPDSCRRFAANMGDFLRFTRVRRRLMDQPGETARRQPLKHG